MVSEKQVGRKYDIFHHTADTSDRQITRQLRPFVYRSFCPKTKPPLLRCRVPFSKPLIRMETLRISASVVPLLYCLWLQKEQRYIHVQAFWVTTRHFSVAGVYQAGRGIYFLRLEDLTLKTDVLCLSITSVTTYPSTRSCISEGSCLLSARLTTSSFFIVGYLTCVFISTCLIVSLLITLVFI